MQVWQEQERKGIWIKVPISKVGLVEVAVRKGFVFHHAEPDYVQITRWLPATDSKLPANASHQVHSTLIQLSDWRCRSVDFSAFYPNTQLFHKHKVPGCSIAQAEVMEMTCVCCV